MTRDEREHSAEAARKIHVIIRENDDRPPWTEDSKDA